MTARKISELTALTTPASGDYLPIVDISEVAAANKNKRITIEELMRGAPNGTAAAPGIAFEGDPTGIYSPGAGQLAISTNSLQRLAIDASGNINIDGGGVYYDAVNNRLAVGTTSPTGTFHIQPANSDIPASALVVRQNNGADTSQNTFSIEIDPINNVSRLISTGTTSPQMSFYTGASERARIDSSGRLLLGASSDSGGALLQVNGDRVRVATAKTPASATDTGTAGEICWDANYVYVCTATNTWKRSALSTW